MKALVLPRFARCTTAAAVLACALAGPASSQEAPRPAASATRVPAPVVQALPESLPLRRDREAASEPGGSWSIAALFGAILLAGGVWLVLRHRAGAKLWPLAVPGAVPRQLERIASQALTQQGSVHVVRWQDEEFLLGCTAQQVTLLGRRPSMAAADGKGPK